MLKVGGARVIFDAQPSLPLTQLEQLGQTLLVFSYRSVTELLTLVGNLSGLSEVSLWSENQSVALHVINQIQVYCINYQVRVCVKEINRGVIKTGSACLGQWVCVIRAGFRPFTAHQSW